MKRSGLTPLLVAATLFLALGLRAEETKPATQALNLPPTASSLVSGPDHAKEMMKSLAGSGDSKLDDQAYAEMLKEQTARQTTATLESGPTGPEQYRQKMMQMFDKNGDGVLDETEREAARQYAGVHAPAHLNYAAELIKRFDLDGDGKLNVEEVSALMKSLRDTRGVNVASGAPTAKDEAARLEKIAAEVARRRELREKAAMPVAPK